MIGFQISMQKLRSIDNITIVGTIDRIDQHGDDGISITDYKTSKTPTKSKNSLQYCKLAAGGAGMYSYTRWLRKSLKFIAFYIKSLNKTRGPQNLEN